MLHINKIYNLNGYMHLDIAGLDESYDLRAQGKVVYEDDEDRLWWGQAPDESIHYGIEQKVDGYMNHRAGYMWSSRAGVFNGAVEWGLTQGIDCWNCTIPVTLAYKMLQEMGSDLMILREVQHDDMGVPTEICYKVIAHEQLKDEMLWEHTTYYRMTGEDEWEVIR